MKYRPVGSTGLRVSAAGLGTGGPSKVGLRAGHGEAESVALIHAALDRGINLLDSSEVYGTEHLIERALRSRRRESVIVSTKADPRAEGHRRTGKEISAALEGSLARLGTDYIDIYYLHRVRADDYGYARDVLLPVLGQLRDQGAIRAVGLSEAFAADTGHRMLQRAVTDTCWDVLMVGFNILNQSARYRVLEPAMEAGISVVGMFAARRALSDPARLGETLAGLATDGYLNSECIDADPVGWLLGDSGAESLTELAYRFCVHEPGIDSVLFGTGNRHHLDANIDALLAPPLPDETTTRLRRLFAHITHVSGN